MKKRCYKCFKTYLLKEFPKKFDTKMKKYYRQNFCKYCLNLRQRELSQTPKYKTKRKKYENYGYYGWNNKFEIEIKRRDHNRKVFDNIWEDKADNLSEITFRLANSIKNRKFFDSIERNKEIIQTRIKHVKKSMKKKRLKITDEKKVLWEMFYYKISMDERNIKHSAGLNVWDKKIVTIFNSQKIYSGYRFK